MLNYLLRMSLMSINSIPSLLGSALLSAAFNASVSSVTVPAMRWSSPAATKQGLSAEVSPGNSILTVDSLQGIIHEPITPSPYELQLYQLFTELICCITSPYLLTPVLHSLVLFPTASHVVTELAYVSNTQHQVSHLRYRYCLPAQATLPCVISYLSTRETLKLTLRSKKQVYNLTSSCLPPV